MINALPTKTEPVTGDKVLLSGASEEYLIDYDKLATAILNKLTSKTFTLDQGTKTFVAALNELNSKTQYQNSIGLVNKGELEYNCQDTSNALKVAYSKLTGTSIFNGLLYAKKTGSASPAYWRIEGLKSSNNYGYIKITSYVNDMEEHKYVLINGIWSWIS
nr:MAG TPA: hypothetical protein [Caudoviricetes sp.]